MMNKEKEWEKRFNRTWKRWMKNKGLPRSQYMPEERVAREFFMKGCKFHKKTGKEVKDGVDGNSQGIS